MADIETHTCDCGFKWLQGRSGAHQCEPLYRETIAELRAALAAATAQSVRMLQYIERSDQRTKDALAALPDAVKAVRAAVEVNDGDTLASMSSNDSIIWVASGSWSGSTAVTLGHLRTIAFASDPLFAPSMAAVTAPQQPAQHKPAADTARLDLLEQMANEPEGILLHDGGDFTGRRGFGLRRIGRTLRQALDAAMAGSAYPAASALPGETPP